MITLIFIITTLYISGDPFLSLLQPNQLTESGKGDYSFFLNIDIQSQFRIGSLTSETPELSVNIEEPDRTRAKVKYGRQLYIF
jgi:hypothetical protein